MGRKNKRKRKSNKTKPDNDEDTTTESSSQVLVECFAWDPFDDAARDNRSQLTSSSAVDALGHPVMEKIWKALQGVKRLHIPSDGAPTPIQVQTWPKLLPSLFDGNDNEAVTRLITLSPTGSGKTLSYGVPLAYRALTNQCSALVLAPTRELAIQIGKNLKTTVKAIRRMPQLAKSPHVNVATLYGGLERDKQIEALEGLKQHGILVSTTGRLLDVLQSASEDERDTQGSTVVAFLKNLAFWVVDESDRMATHTDLSQQVDEILPYLPGDAVRIFASATWPNDTAKWKEWLWGSQETPSSAHPLLKSCAVVRVNPNSIKPALAKLEQSVTKSSESDTKTKESKDVIWSDIPSNITQTLHICAEHKKPRKLVTTLQKLNKESGRQKPLCIVFFATIKTLRYCTKLLSKEGISCLELHSHMPQNVRERNIQTFSSGKAPLLLATDICARGVHVNGVRAVIQYDFPGNMEQYIHRCGRAGRDGKPATVFSFFTRNLQSLAPGIIELLKKSKQWIDPNLLLLAEASSKNPAKRQRTAKKPGDAKQEAATQNTDSDDDSFATLEASRIVLKRSKNVSDTSDDGESEGEGDD